MSRKQLSLFDRTIAGRAAIEAFRKLDPRLQLRNPVMFVVFVGSLLATVLWVQALANPPEGGEAPAGFILAIALWLWFTLLFANFAEAMAEGRGKAQADALRRSRREIMAKELGAPERGAPFHLVPASQLEKGAYVLIEAGDLVPADGEVVQGIASVDESAVTGESAPVIREAGGDLNAVCRTGSSCASPPNRDTLSSTG
jgi:K+-transporting ATPase ATPase B chain